MEEQTRDEQLLDVLNPDQEVSLEEGQEDLGPAVETQEQVDEPQEPEPQQRSKPETPEEEMQEVRFRTLRENSKRYETENKILKDRLDALERAQRQATPQAPVKPEDQLTEAALAPDDFVEGKHLSKYEQKIKAMDQKLAEYERQSHMNTVDAQIKSKYPDFDHVVTKENMQVLYNAYPEIASTIATSNDLYSQAASAYQLIKKLGILPDDMVIKRAKRVIQNSDKPIPTGSVHSKATADSPLASANSFAEDMTEEEKASVWAQLQANARQGR